MIFNSPDQYLDLTINSKDVYYKDNVMYFSGPLPAPYSFYVTDQEIQQKLEKALSVSINGGTLNNYEAFVKVKVEPAPQIGLVSQVIELEIKSSKDNNRKDPLKPNQNTSFQETAAPWSFPEMEPYLAPVALPGYYSKNSSSWRIGYASLDMPIVYFSHTRETTIEQMPMLRSPGTIKKGTGQAYETFNLSYICAGSDQLYRGVTEVFEQISLTPFISVEGGPFGNRYENLDPDESSAIPYNAIAIRNFSISTIPTQPNAVQVDIAFDPFDWEFYLPPQDGEYPRASFDDAICWPVFKTWAKQRTKSLPLDDVMDGSFRLSIPDSDLMKSIQTELITPKVLTNSEDYYAIQGIISLLKNEAGDVKSNNAKRIEISSKLYSSAADYLVVKVKDKSTYEKLLQKKYYAGLVYWNKYEGNNYTSDVFLPQSTAVKVQDVSTPFVGRPIANQKATIGADDIADIKKGSTKTIATQIEEFAYRSLNLTTPPASSSFLYDTWITRKTQFAEAPHEYFGVLLVSSNAEERAKIQADFGALATTLKENIGYNITASRDEVENYIEKSRNLLDAGPNGIHRNIIIERISGSRGHNLGVMSQKGNPLPIHSYMGGLDGTFAIEGTCIGTASKKILENIKAEFDRLAIRKESHKIDLSTVQQRMKSSSAIYLIVQNEIFKMLGVDYVIPVSINFTTVESEVDTYKFSMTFLQFDPKQAVVEQMRFLKTSSSSFGNIYQYGFNFSGRDPIFDRAREYFSLENSLSAEEVYPDLQLPTYAELEYWLGLIRRAAEDYKENTKDFSLAKYTTAQQEIIRPIVEFLPVNFETIINTFKPDEYQVARYSPNNYAEPDFYIYYDPRQSFGSDVDGLAKHLMGEREGLTAKPRERDDNKTQPGAYVEHDQLGLSTNYGVSHWGVNPAVSPIEKNITDALANTYPTARRDQVLKIYNEEADQKLNQNSQAWWQSAHSYGSKVTDNSAILKEDKEFYRVRMPDEAFIPDNDSSGTPLPARIALNDLEDFFKYRWRQELHVDLSRLIPAQEIDMNYTLERFAPIREENLDATKNPNLSNAPEGYSIADLKSSLLKTINGSFNRENQKEQWYSDNLMISRENWSRGIYSTRLGFVNGVALVNANFRFNSKRSEAPEFISGSDNLIRTWNYIDYKCAKAELPDPNIIRSILYMRDNFGSSNTGNLPGSLDPSFGNLDATPDDKLKTSIDVIIKIYSDFWVRYNYNPSIALMATTMMIDSKARSQFLIDGKIKPEVDQNLLAFSTTDARFSEEFVTSIKKASDQYAIPGNALYAYYQGYLKIGRAKGTYQEKIKGQSDPYFNPTNPIFMVETGDNTGSTITKFTPNGSEAIINSSRILDNNINGLGDEFDDLPLDVRVPLSKKHRSALQPHTEGAIYGMISDFRKYSPIGKLAGAFPGYQILLINEGVYWSGGSNKLWDQFYTRTGVANIEVFSSRNNPGKTCSITFSNMFHSLASYAQQEAILHDIAVKNEQQYGEALLFKNTEGKNIFSSIGQAWKTLVEKQIPDEIRVLWQNNHLKKLALNVGTRVQVRMGYGSRADRLPVVFMGAVADAPVAEGFVVLNCVSDGHELEKAISRDLVKTSQGFAFQNGGMFGAGKDPSNIVTDSLLGVTIFDNILQGQFRDTNAGVAHFGDVYFEQQRQFPAEVQINLYSAQSKLEQGVSWTDAINYFNGFTNWDGDINRITVEVQEPTPWKVLEVCRRACNDFVASAETFALRSTVFFGKWWWPYNYSYHPSILDIDQSSPFFYSETDKSYQMDNDGSRSKESKEKIIKALENKKFDTLKEFLTQNNIKLENISNFVYVPADSKRFSSERALRGAYVDSQTNNIGEIYVGDIFQIGYQSETIEIIFEEDGYKITDRRLNSSITRNTFGKQKYNILDSGNPTSIEGPPVDMLRNVEKLVAYLRWKPYTQAYIANSFVNLLDNNIRADSENVYTDAIGIYNFNGYLSAASTYRTHSYSVDSDITTADRKTFTVDTGLMVTGTQAGILGVANDLMNIPAINLSFLFKDYIQSTPTTPAIQNGVVNSLADQVKEMYQGWFTITGTPSVKPRDFFLFSDHHLNMKGPIMVKDVIHRLDSNVGLITIISPDALVIPNGSVIAHQTITSLMSGILNRIGGFMVYKTLALSFKRTIARFKDQANLRQSYKGWSTWERSKKIKSYSWPASERPDPTAIGPRPNVSDPSLTNHFKLSESLSNFEIELEKELKEISDLIDSGSIRLAKGVDKNTVLERHANTKRAKWAAGNKALIDKVFPPIKADELTNIIKELIEDIDEIKILKSRTLLSSSERSTLNFLEDRIRLRFARVLEVDADEVDWKEINKDILKMFNVKFIADNDGLNPVVGGIRDGLRSNVDVLSRVKEGFKEVSDVIFGAKRILLPGEEATRPTSLFTLIRTQRDFYKKLNDYTEELKGLGIDPAAKTFIGTAEEIELNQIRSSINATTDLIKAATTTKFMSSIRSLKYGISLAKYAGPQALFSLVWDATIGIIGSSFIQGYNSRLLARQSLKIFPLKVNGIPFTAGIKGHQGAVIGDNPSWGDELIRGIHGAYVDSSYRDAFNIGLALTGVEFPDNLSSYQSTAWDSLYGDIIEDERLSK